MKIGYARVSTANQELYGQSLTTQVERLEAAGCEKIIQEVGSGADVQREGYQQLMTELRKGDEVIVVKLDRFGRSLGDLIQQINTWDAQDITLKSLDDGVDTSTPMGKAMAQLVSVFAEMERERIMERTKEGIDRARREGKRFGRPPKRDENMIAEAKRLHATDSLTSAQAARAIGVSRGHYYRLLKM